MHLGDPTTFFDALGGSDNIFRCTWGDPTFFSMHLGDPTTFFDVLGGSDNIFRCTWGDPTTFFDALGVIQHFFSMHLGWSNISFRCTWGDPTTFFDALSVPHKNFRCTGGCRVHWLWRASQSPQYQSIPFNPGKSNLCLGNLIFSWNQTSFGAYLISTKTLENKVLSIDFKMRFIIFFRLSLAGWVHWLKLLNFHGINFFSTKKKMIA